MLLRGKVAVVTGSSRGIGRAIAMGMADEGAKVVINYVTHAREAAEVRDRITGKGGTALALKADVSKLVEVQAMVRTTVEELGSLDILVNNAAVVVGKRMIDTDPEEWDRIFRCNIYGCFYCTQNSARQMIRQGRGGKIVNISSICGSLGIDARAAYSATKGAIDAFTRCCALELAPHRINVNGVAPGATDTEINLKLYTSAVRRALARRIPLGEIAKPEDMVGAVVFLASDAARYITGQTISVDGGWTQCDYTPLEYEEAKGG